VDLAPRLVRIDRLSCRRYDYPWLDVDVTCGKGTYIRSLARDVGQLLGCGAYVVKLVRTAVGPFPLEQAMSWEVDAGVARQRLEPLRRAVEHLPHLVVDPHTLWRLRHGQKLPWPDTVGQAGPLAIVDEHGQLHLLALARSKDRRIVPRLVLQLGPES
jgi:tRNA pseudouridine55 synthase